MSKVEKKRSASHANEENNCRQAKKPATNEKGIAEMKKKCPLSWEGNLEEILCETATVTFKVCTKDDEAEADHTEMMKKVSEYLDVDGKAAHTNLEDFDSSKVEAKLRKDKSNIFVNVGEFTEDGIDGYWFVSCQEKQNLTEGDAKELLDRLFQGKLCKYPEAYDNFGKTPFGPGDDDGDEGEFDEDEMKQIAVIKDSVMQVLSKASAIEHAYWDGLCEGDSPECSIEREDFIFFQISGDDPVKFLLKFEWLCEGV